MLETVLISFSRFAGFEDYKFSFSLKIPFSMLHVLEVTETRLDSFLFVVIRSLFVIQFYLKVYFTKFKTFGTC